MSKFLRINALIAISSMRMIENDLKEEEESMGFDTASILQQGILKQMSLDVHRRKYSLIISGIPGEKGKLPKPRKPPSWSLVPEC